MQLGSLRFRLQLQTFFIRRLRKLSVKSFGHLARLTRNLQLSCHGIVPNPDTDFVFWKDHETVGVG